MQWPRIYTVIVATAASGLLLVGAACSTERVAGEVSTTTATTTRAAVQAEVQPAMAARDSFDHSAFERLLVAYVDEHGWVDYPGLAGERVALDAYLNRLATAGPQSFTADHERLAFWINAYNAFTLRDVLDDVYRKAASVQDVAGFFNRKRHRIAGEDLTLDEIEQRGRDFRDPRIHFTVVCASTSCPKLQRFAYNGAQLDAQLDRVTREFLLDEQRGMRLDRAGKRLYVSSLFKWYAADFKGQTGKVAFVVELAKAAVTGGQTLDYIKGYVPSDVARFISEEKPGVGFLKYDWSLNAQETHTTSLPGATP